MRVRIGSIRFSVAVVVFLATLFPVGLTSSAHALGEVPRPGWVPNAAVFTVAAAGDRVYLGGQFTSLRNSLTGEVVPRSRLAALDATTGELVRDWAPAANADVRALAVSDEGSSVFAGGAFTTINGAPAERVVALGRDGAPVPGFAVSANNTVRALVAQGDALYIGGLFGRVNGKSRVGLARVDAGSGALNTTWVANVGQGRVWALGLSADGQNLVSGGSFHLLGGASRSFLGAVGLASGTVTAWEPALCGTCYVLDVDTDSDAANTYAATAGPGGRLVAFQGSTAQPLWAVRGDGNVQAVAHSNGLVYAGGHFGPTFGDAERHQLAAVDATDGSLTDFSPTVTGNDKPGVWDLVAGDEFLRVGGAVRTGGPLNLGRYVEFTY